MKAHCAVRDLNRNTHFHVLQYTHRLCYMGLWMSEVPVIYLLVSKDQQMPPHQKYDNEKWGKTDISQLFGVHMLNTWVSGGSGHLQIHS